MDIVAALFVEGIDIRTAFEGGPTLIDLQGVHFSAPAPAPPPVTMTPHLVVLVRCAPDEPGSGVLEVVFRRGDDQVARNVQPLQVDPGKFTYRLVRAELDLDDYGTVEAHCRVDTGLSTVVPYTLVPAPAPTPEPMAFVNALSLHPDAAEATGDVVGRVLEGLDAVPDLAVVFCSADHLDALGEIAATIRALISPRVLVGAAAGSVVGGDVEAEQGPALSLWAATLPAVPRPVRLTAARTPSGVALQGLAVADLPMGATVGLVADPFTVPVEAVLDAVDAAGTGARVVGGLASASATPGGNRLVLDGEVHSSGAVGFVLDGSTPVSTVVSQGCRPVGRPMIVTAAEGNVIGELAGLPALERVEELAQRAGPEERALLASGLHLGLAIDEHRATFGRGDFLVRGVLGADRAAGAVVVGDTVEVGTTVQFHVRDADAADEDLRALLAPATGDGALLFTCNGRGSGLFGEPDHDARALRDALGTDAIAGMSCAGEVGPVGGRSFVHGFTASVLLFHDR